MDSVKIEDYVKQVFKLAERNIKNPQTREELFSLIEGHRQACGGNRPFEEFFKGEAAFYNEQYDKALKHYIQATTVPDFQFYCYRASAFVSYERHDKEKGDSFLEKASAIRPDDFSLKNLRFKKNETGTSEGASGASLKHAEPRSQLLSQIFEGKPEKRELFAEELPPPSFIPNGKPESPQTENEKIEISSVGLLEREVEDEISISLIDPKTLFKELESPSKEPLKTAIRNFQLSQSKLTEDYLARKRETGTGEGDFQLEVLHGWPESLEDPLEVSLLTKHSRVSSGGYFLRWNGKGIVVNPGKHFMKYFHAHGHHIRDIDFVIISRNAPEAYEDIKEIYELNQELNKNTPELQIIHYYLNSETFQELSNYLKPSFKQARNTVHCLELFYDSPDVERMEIAEGIWLNYFPTQVSVRTLQNREIESLTTKALSNLGFRLDLTRKNGAFLETKKVGFLGGCPWSPLLAHLMGSCDLLLLGFGHTQPSDYEKLAYNNDCLGLYGSFTLFEEVLPKLLICSEFDGLEGDVRFEVVKLIREEHTASQNYKSKPAYVIPGDVGLKIDLTTLQVICSVTKNKMLPEQLHVVKSLDRFGRLKFLSKECAL